MSEHESTAAPHSSTDVDSPTVRPAERLAELMIGDEMAYGDTLVYEFRAGYEILRHEVEGGGSSEYRGVYHPNQGYCETKPFTADSGSGVCYWCGRTLF